jgi:hypothetical protein
MELPPPTFEGSDKLGRNLFCQRLEKYLLIEHSFVEGSVVIALHGKFGSGKTSFLKMWKHDLLKRRKLDPVLPDVVYLNAWENNFCGDPLLAIITKLLDSLEARPGVDRKNLKILRDAVAKVAWFVPGLSSSSLAAKVNIDFMRTGSYAEKFVDGGRMEPADIVALYNFRTSAFQELQTALRTAFSHPDKQIRALVLVDELDRCRPEFAIQFLETVKHVFDIAGLTFVMAVDDSQLNRSVKCVFGENTPVEEYLRRFFHRTFSLPEPEAQDLISNLTEGYLSRYLTSAFGRHSLELIGDEVVALQILTANAGITPRQIQEVFRLLAHAIGGDVDGYQRKPANWNIGLVFLCVLKVMKNPLFQRILAGETCWEEVGNVLGVVTNESTGYGWSLICMTGLGMKGEDVETLKQILERNKISAIHGQEQLQTDLCLYAEQWRTRMSSETSVHRFSRIAKRIEEAETLR